MGSLVFAFIVFYSMIHLGCYLPDLYTGKFSLVDERSYDKRLLSLMVDMGLSFLFTFAAYLILYRLYPSKKYILLAVALASAFISCFVISYLAAQLGSEDHVRLSRFFREQVLFDAFYTVFAMVFYFIRYAQFKELQQRELAIQNRESELSFLRSQINPHFLFNNLNNIYSMVYHQSDQSLKAIAGLSELLRYRLYDTSETISIEKEIHFIEQYISLEQLRFEKPSMINFSIKCDERHAQLPPLLLIPFIENAFKHGNVSFDRVWLDISLSTTADQQIILSCTNDLGVKRKDPSIGIGIDNVSKRLALLYPDNHSLNIEQQGSKYRVTLKLGKYSSKKESQNEIS